MRCGALSCGDISQPEAGTIPADAECERRIDVSNRSDLYDRVLSAVKVLIELFGVLVSAALAGRALGWW